MRSDSHANEIIGLVNWMSSNYKQNSKHIFQNVIGYVILFKENIFYIFNIIFLEYKYISILP